MPRAKQARLSEPKKGSASTKSPSDEELSPKRAVKALKDSERYQQNKLNPKTGILDKCVLCKKSGVRTMLEGAGSATNMRCFIKSKLKIFYADEFVTRFHLAAEHYFPEGKFIAIAPPTEEDLEPGKSLPKDLMGKTYKYSCHLQVSNTR